MKQKVFSIPIRCRNCGHPTITNPCELCDCMLEGSPRRQDLYDFSKVNGCPEGDPFCMRRSCRTCTHFKVGDKVKLINIYGMFQGGIYVVMDVHPTNIRCKHISSNEMYGKFPHNVVKIDANEIEWWTTQR